MVDQLGNIRVVFDESGSTTKQYSHYYPFGMRFNQASSSSNNTNKYLYNGKEFQNEVGLDWYDYGARFYDPQLGRWQVPDPLAEYDFKTSPYTYVSNNPMRFIDPFGLQQDTTYIVPEPIPEVVVTYTPPPKPSSSGFISLLYEIDRLLMGNHNPSKIRDATRFEEWCIRNFDMSEVKRIGEIFGDDRAEGANNNKVRTSESY